MKQFTPIAALVGLIPLVNAHGFVTSPTARMPGDAMASACGQQVEINQQSDNYGNIQGELQVANGQSDYSASECDIWLCKGYKFADNKDNVYSYTAGETVDFTVDIRAPPHRCCQRTSSNSVIGSPLISWSVYASTATGVTSNETDFSVTMPDDLGSKCSTAGDCVLQWYWYAESIDQTYESCVDFTLAPAPALLAPALLAPALLAPALLAPPARLRPKLLRPPSTSAAAETTAAPVETSATPVLYATTTFATQARQSAAPSVEVQTASAVETTASSAGSVQPIPTDGTAQEQLSFVESIMKYLANSE
ncbi:hypothetical protein N7509_006976 [Penicillium cosmopolitanum]|uniref:Chitin-binding type-4 domain-containing protein n=1 Tax=Penicillium cosmopolitanum TaxID=1131564 RepID=A0A9W9VY98_9EURO|nr:uncharacterized protein N7509_006976 [Penicillium cosmopolitanum]KAJ5391486.1 hypothetical protein N7509_006976 [Penicillium cosmopolitanum]